MISSSPTGCPSGMLDDSQVWNCPMYVSRVMHPSQPNTPSDTTRMRGVKLRINAQMVMGIHDVYGWMALYSSFGSTYTWWYHAMPAAAHAATTIALRLYRAALDMASTWVIRPSRYGCTKPHSMPKIQM